MTRPTISLRRFAKSVVFGTAAILGATSCIDRPVAPASPRTNDRIVLQSAQNRIRRIDLLFMIDNSSSMADKQQVLKSAIPALVNRLVDPDCVDEKGQVHPHSNSCPEGTQRDFEPVQDIHIGIISSSLGAHGADACPTDKAESKDSLDMAHLLKRMPGGASAPADFLWWNTTSTQDVISTFQQMVEGVGETGCGYEASLESVYRFLIDPSPYKTIEREGDFAIPKDIDVQLLRQRSEFLRPDSLVAVVMVSDENDASIADVTADFSHGNGSMNWLPLSSKNVLKRGSSLCDKNPNDKCCYSCNTPVPPGCQSDPICNLDPLKTDEDPRNLRAFDQKRRYGFDFLFDIKTRYAAGFTQQMITDLRTQENGQPKTVLNPLFADLTDPACRDQNICTRPAAREPEIVFVAGIVGVPWQDIAKDPKDLRKGYKTAAQLKQPIPGINGTGWDLILGNPNPGNYQPPVPPLDPLMREQVKARTGRSPIIGVDLAPPESSYDANPINGHEWNPAVNQVVNDDLQYACVFELETPKECGGKDQSAPCDCKGTNNDARMNPLCQDKSGKYGTTQYRAKGYPGLRQLQLLQELGDQAIVASICPAKNGKAFNQSDPDYGYNPAVNALINRLRNVLRGRCMSRKIATRDEDGSVACVVLDVFEPTGGRVCDCAGLARKQPEADVIPADVDKNKCVCEITQIMDPAQRHACQTSVMLSSDISGWCYVDPEVTGKEACSIVRNCGVTEKRSIRYTDNAEPIGTGIIVCQGAAYRPEQSSSSGSQVCNDEGPTEE